MLACAAIVAANSGHANRKLAAGRYTATAMAMSDHAIKAPTSTPTALRLCIASRFTATVHANTAKATAAA